MDNALYLSSLDILSEDFRRVAEFVEPVDANFKTYSHRLYELLLRACTDIESACKERLVEDGYPTAPDKMNVNDYKTLESTLKLEVVGVGIQSWRPQPRYFRPFENWSANQPPLTWYKAYIIVKHNRVTDFDKASLENVSLALAGLVALLFRLDILTTESYQGADNIYEKSFPKQGFSVRYPEH